MISQAKLKDEWKKGIYSEISFWEDWIKTKGGQWKEEYEQRTNPDSNIQEIFLKYVNKSLSKNKILDVGAGPLTIINKKCNLTELEICAVDPLADEYDKLLHKYNIIPIVKTQKLDGEKLTEKYDSNSFDITYSRNAIDHAYNPLKIIEEMIKVTKNKGYIILQLFDKEGSRAKWNGLHNWNFYLKNNNLFLKGKDAVEFNVFDMFKDAVKLTDVMLENRLITVVFRKI